MAGEDKAYLAWVRSLPCRKCHGRPCEAHHPTHLRKGARRAHDRDAMPLCRTCHHDLHGLCGQFKGWVRERLQRWQNENLVAVRLLRGVAGIEVARPDDTAF